MAFLTAIGARVRTSARDWARQRFAPVCGDERAEGVRFNDWLLHRGGWRALVYVALVATAMGAGARAVLGWRLSLVASVVLFNVVAFALLFGVFVSWVGHHRMHDRWVSMTLEGLLGAAVSGAAMLAVLTWLDGRPLFTWLPWPVFVQLVTWTVVALVVYLAVLILIATLRHREHEAVARQVESEARRNEVARRLAESDLRLLRAQIEPHFLFNTLGSAQQLAVKDGAEAARLLGDLIRFLRAATPLRGDTTTVQAEAGLVEAYLAIMARRLGPRLSYAMEVEPSVSGVTLPPGMVITLVENAIKHGIEPSVQGGEVRVRIAPTASDCVEIVVADSGMGLGAATPGQGLGLANIRERLSLLYGERASLELAEREPRGFVARIRLPAQGALTPAAAVATA